MKPLQCPGINCNCACESCGFNPWEQKRRLKQGHFENIRVSHKLHDDDGHVVHVAKGVCKTLVFKKGVSEYV